MVTVRVRGAWRVELLALACRVLGREVAITLARSGLFDPAIRVGGTPWQRISLAEELSA